MALFPKIDSPCPLRASDLPRSGDFHCGHCDRNVHDLTPLTDSERLDFLADCNEPVCVRYEARARSGANLAAAALAAALVAGSPLGAAAQGDTTEAALDCAELVTIAMGGVENPEEAQFEELDRADDAELAQPPVIVED